MRLIKRLFRNTALWLMVLLFAFSAAISNRSTEGVGDRLQVTLPLAGLGCAIATGQGVRYLGRYLVLTFTYQGLKEGLGEAPINIRPNGGDRGFPSGHMSAATFGAAGLITTCLKGNPAAQSVAVMAAGFVGGTRIEVRAHDTWQVLAAAILGWWLQVAALGAFDRWFRRALGWCGRRLAGLGRWVAARIDAMTGAGPRPGG